MENNAGLSSNGYHLPVGLHHPPRRIVSLVPSMTESLITLGFGDAVVGCTDYCVRPAGLVDHLARVGGTKNPRLDDILSLTPDLVIVNQEENSQQVVQHLKVNGLPVWVTFPKSVRNSMDDLWQIVGIFRNARAAAQLEMLEKSIEWAQAVTTQGEQPRYFCPIWYEQTDEGKPWWMVFNQDTYAHDVLQLAGGVNIFGDRQRRYPLMADIGDEMAETAGERDTRYPRVTFDEIVSAQPTLILLPDEPYLFTEEDLDRLKQLLSETPAVKTDRVYLIDGSLITWHGTRIAAALRTLPTLLAANA